jgi:hypothetical protein
VSTSVVKARRQHGKFRTGVTIAPRPFGSGADGFCLQPGPSEITSWLVRPAFSTHANGAATTIRWDRRIPQPHDARGGVQPVENLAAAPNGAPIWCKPLNRSVFASVTAL